MPHPQARFPEPWGGKQTDYKEGGSRSLAWTSFLLVVLPRKPGAELPAKWMQNGRSLDNTETRKKENKQTKGEIKNHKTIITVLLS